MTLRLPRSIVLAAGVALLWAPDPSHAAASAVQIVDGGKHPVHIASQAGGKQRRHFEVRGEPLVVVAEGPLTLSLKLRGVGELPLEGELKIVRANGAPSHTAISLGADRGAIARTPEGRRLWVTEQRTLHLQVPAAQHRYEISVPGESIVVRVTKTAKFKPDLSVSPEGSPSTLLEEASGEVPEGAASVNGESMTGAAGPDASTWGGGFFLTPRTGALVFDGFLDGFVPEAQSSLLDGRTIDAPFALEVGYDFTPMWGVFLEGGYVGTSSEQQVGISGDPDLSSYLVRMKVQAIPLSLGPTFFVSLTRWLGLRLRAGATFSISRLGVSTGAAADSLFAQAPRDGMGLGWVAGLGLEMTAGPGRFTLEGRFQSIRIGLGRDFALPWGPTGPDNTEFGGAAAVAGYRFHL